MNSSQKKAAGLMLSVLIAFGVIAANLHAAPAQGRFTLPFDVQWGNLALQTGDYTFSLDHLTSTGTVIVYRGAKAVGFVHPETLENMQNQSEKPVLLCMRHDGKVTVRALRLPNVGTLVFPVSKELTLLAAQQPQRVESLSIEVTGE
jgi:hypothetical protein